MLKLTDKEKFDEIAKRTEKLINCCDLLLDSTNQYFGEEENNKFHLLSDWFDKYLWEIRGILGFNGDDFEL